MNFMKPISRLRQSRFAPQHKLFVTLLLRHRVVHDDPVHWATFPSTSHGGFLFYVLAMTACLIGLARPSIGHAENAEKPIFELTIGKGKDVCDAYLVRLNKTRYVENLPEWGRLAEPEQEGFDKWPTVPLTAQQIQVLYSKLVSFYRYRNQDALDIYEAANAKPGNRSYENKFVLEMIKKSMEREKDTPFVRFQPLLDLDNDGVATDVVIQNTHSAYIVDDSLQRIDADKMIALFADPELLKWPNIVGFPPLAYPLHIFGYKGKYYFDGFLNLIFTTNPYLSPHLSSRQPLQFGVFIHEKGQTRKACEYRWTNGAGTFKPGSAPFSYYK